MKVVGLTYKLQPGWSRLVLRTSAITWHLSQKPESIVVLKTIALCCAQTIATPRTQEDTNAAREQERRDLRRGRCNRRLGGEALVSIDPGQRGVVLRRVSLNGLCRRPSTDGL